MSSLPTKQYDHEATNIREADGGQQGQQVADVVPLHPAGTFSSNTQAGDVINGLARDLGVKPPNNVTKFPSKK